MTYLELCQMLARESGLVAGVQPASVAGQTGRLLKFIAWTDTAWRAIQNAEGTWRWMQGEFGSAATLTTAGALRYTAASFNLARWASWIDTDDTLTIYAEAEGAADETPLVWVRDWNLWRRMYERGAQVQNRPIHAAISPAGELCLGPAPDAIYRVRGLYRKSPQRLVENDDVPEMPGRFHELIVWEALLLLEEDGEGGALPLAKAVRRRTELMSSLRRDQLPQPYIGAGGLA